MLQRIKNSLSIKNIIILILFIAIGYTAYGKWFKVTTPIKYEYTKLQNRDIEQIVEGSGHVSSLQELAVQPQGSGQIVAVYVKPGDYVKSGQILAKLDSRSASIQLTQAQASYDKIINGATNSDVELSRINVKSAELNLEQVKKNQDIAIKNAHTTLLNSSLSLDTQNSIIADKPTISGSYNCEEEGQYKISFQATGGSGILVSVSGLENDYVYTQSSSISSIPTKIGKCGLYLNFDPSKNYNQSSQFVINVPNTLAANYLTNLNSYNNALQNKDKAISDAQISLDTANLQLNQKIATARPEDIASAKASLASAQLSYSNTIVRAPFDGQIGAVGAVVGAQASSGSSIATIVTKSKIADISLNEVDIANVKMGQEVRLSFDAIPDLSLIGKVVQINTIGTTVSNVVSFSVRVQFEEDNERVKSGMSVNTNIVVSSVKSVPTIENSAIQEDGEITFVQVKDATSTRNRTVEIKIGARNDLYSQVLSGLSSDDQVVLKALATSSSVKTTTAGFSLFGGGAARAGR